MLDVHKYQSCPGCRLRTAVPLIYIHIPTALMLTLRPDGRRQRNATPSTQIIVSLLGRLSKVCSTLTRAAARRSRPFHRPSIVRRNSTQSGIDAASILCHHLLHRASASLSINQSSHPACPLCCFSLPQHTNIKLKGTIPLSFRLWHPSPCRGQLFWPSQHALVSYRQVAKYVNITP